MRAISDDGIHRFECRNVEAVKETVTYSVPEGVMKCSRSKFVKLRNRIFGNSNYMSNPTYYIKVVDTCKESRILKIAHKYGFFNTYVPF